MNTFTPRIEWNPRPSETWASKITGASNKIDRDWLKGVWIEKGKTLSNRELANLIRRKRHNKRAGSTIGKLLRTAYLKHKHQVVFKGKLRLVTDLRERYIRGAYA